MKFLTHTAYEDSTGDLFTKLLTHRVAAETTGEFFAKIVFLPLLLTILNFCIKDKNMFILQADQDREISTKFLTHRVSAESTGNFSTNGYLATFGDQLEFLCKMQKHVYFRILKKYFIPTEYLHSLLWTFCKNFFPTPLMAILNVCVRHKNAFISEMVKARAILTKFLTSRVCVQSTGKFLPNNFHATFGGRLEFLLKMQEHVCLTNGES